MLIDWFTVAAQLVNFLILIGLLKRFLYRPVLKVIDEREKKIAGELGHAAQVQQEAAGEKAEWGQKNHDFEQQRAEMTKRAEDEGERQRQQLLEQARDEYDSMRNKFQDALRQQQADHEQETAKDIRSEVFAVAGKILEELAGMSIEARMAQLLCERLRNAGEKEMSELTVAFRKPSRPPVVRSRFVLGTEQREMISATVRELFHIDLPLTFETADELISGIELSVNGQRIAWSFSDALEAMNTHAERLSERSTTSHGNTHGTTRA
jgi:F-type H+-transporting ATPase subunit b